MLTLKKVNALVKRGNANRCGTSLSLKDLVESTDLPRSVFYYHQRSLKLENKYAYVKEEMTKTHHGRYGYRRMKTELKQPSITFNHKTVYRLMKEAGLHCTVRLRKYNSYHGEIDEKAPNLLIIDFTASQTNIKWATDITEFHFANCQSKLDGRFSYLSKLIRQTIPFCLI